MENPLNNIPQEVSEEKQEEKIEKTSVPTIKKANLLKTLGFATAAMFGGLASNSATAQTFEGTSNEVHVNVNQEKFSDYEKKYQDDDHVFRSTTRVDYIDGQTDSHDRSRMEVAQKLYSRVYPDKKSPMLSELTDKVFILEKSIKIVENSDGTKSLWMAAEIDK